MSNLSYWVSRCRRAPSQTVGNANGTRTTSHVRLVWRGTVATITAEVRALGLVLHAVAECIDAKVKEHVGLPRDARMLCDGSVIHPRAVPGMGTYHVYTVEHPSFDDVSEYAPIPVWQWSGSPSITIVGLWPETETIVIPKLSGSVHHLCATLREGD